MEILQQTILKEHERPEYSLMLRHQEIWWPSTACWTDQTDFVRYEFQDEIRVELHLPYYEASLGIVKLKAEYAISEYKQSSHTEEELLEKAKGKAAKEWEKLTRERNVLTLIYDGMTNDELLSEVWNLYNTNSIPRKSLGMSPIFYEQEIMPPQSLQNRLDEVKEKYESLERALERTLSESLEEVEEIKRKEIERYGFGSWMFHLKAWLDRISRERAIYDRFIRESGPAREMVASILPEIRDHPLMLEEENLKMEADGRELFRNALYRNLSDLRLKEKQKKFWRKHLGISGL